MQQMSVKDQRIDELLRELQEKTNLTNRLIDDIDGMLMEVLHLSLCI